MRSISMLGWMLAGLLGSVAVTACGDDGDGPPGASRNSDFAAVIKGVENPFFSTMRDGLVDTARRNNIKLRVASAAGLDDTEGQASALAGLAVDRSECYVVNPINRTNLVSPLAHLPRDTPVVNIDSPIDRDAAKALGVRVVTYIGTNNVAAGSTAADAMVGLVGRGSAVAVVRGIPGDAGSEARARGFKLEARGRLSVVASVAADFSREQARLATRDLIESEPRLRGFFAVNDDMALGIAQGARDAGVDVAIIGMDGIPEALEAVASGRISATVAQYPYTVGQLGIEACLAVDHGKKVPARIDAPVQVVTPANVALAQRRLPRPVAPFEDPLAHLLDE